MALPKSIKTPEGHIFTMANGEKLEVLHYENAKTIVVAFCDDKTFPFIAHIGNLRKGKYKNPYTKSVYGVGYIGCGEFSPARDRKAYKSWLGMVRRVFDDYAKTRRPSTVDLLMANEWRCFQNFASWATKQKGYDISGFELDKDLLIYGNNIYRGEYCCFLPREINTALPKRNSSTAKVYPYRDCNNSLYTLYQSQSRDYKRGIRISIKGSFSECYNWKRKATQNLLLCLMEKYKDSLDERVILRLSNFYGEKDE